MDFILGALAVFVFIWITIGSIKTRLENKKIDNELAEIQKNRANRKVKTLDEYRKEGLNEETIEKIINIRVINQRAKGVMNKNSEKIDKGLEKKKEKERMLTEAKKSKNKKLADQIQDEIKTLSDDIAGKRANLFNFPTQLTKDVISSIMDSKGIPKEEQKEYFDKRYKNISKDEIKGMFE